MQEEVQVGEEVEEEVQVQVVQVERWWWQLRD